MHISVVLCVTELIDSIIYQMNYICVVSLYLPCAEHIALLSCKFVFNASFGLPSVVSKATDMFSTLFLTVHLVNLLDFSWIIHDFR